MNKRKVAKKTATATRKPVARLPFKVGDCVFIRAVTYHHVGRVADILPDMIVLTDASWVADSDRFAAALRDGTLKEVERCGDWVCIGRGAIVDIHPWAHAVPVATK